MKWKHHPALYSSIKQNMILQPLQIFSL